MLFKLKYPALLIRRISYFLLLYLAGIVISCSTQQKLAKYQNLAYIYNPSSSLIHPQFRLFNTNDTVTWLFFKVNKSELKLLHSDENNIYLGKIKVRYVLFNNFEKSEVVDSSSVIFNIETIEQNDFFNSHVQMKTPQKTNYSLFVIVSDLQAGTWFQTFLFVRKSSVFSAQNYIMTSKKDNEIYYNEIISSKDTFRIKNPRFNGNKLYVKYFRNKFPMPIQPYSIVDAKPFNFKPDSSWVMNFSDTTYINFSKKGIYHLQGDSVNKDGLTLFYFNDDYPVVKTPEALLSPVQYLSTSKEWNEFMQYHSRKEAMDDFWLKMSGNTDRAKELIRVYYNRVMLANKYFNSYTEGWKTDRGMIYIIFGLPSTIYKSDDRERWVYGKNENIGEMVFDFVRNENPLTINDFTLMHYDKYKNVWYIAVETWRDGRIFSVAN